MPGRRTGFHFAWACFAVLAAGLPRELRTEFRWPLRHERFLLSLPQKEGAERRRARGQRPCRSSTATGLDHFRGRPRLTALHCGVFSALASTLGPRCPLAPAWPFGSGRGHGTSPRRLSCAGRPDPGSPGITIANRDRRRRSPFTFGSLANAPQVKGDECELRVRAIGVNR